MPNNLERIKKEKDIQELIKVMKTIKALRKNLKYSAVDFAMECGLTEKAYSSMEREGRGTPYTLLRILSKFREIGVAVDDILQCRTDITTIYRHTLSAERERHLNEMLTKNEKILINSQSEIII